MYWYKSSDELWWSSSFDDQYDNFITLQHGLFAVKVWDEDDDNGSGYINLGKHDSLRDAKIAAHKHLYPDDEITDDMYL